MKTKLISILMACTVLGACNKYDLLEEQVLSLEVELAETKEALELHIIELQDALIVAQSELTEAILAGDNRLEVALTGAVDTLADLISQESAARQANDEALALELDRVAMALADAIHAEALARANGDEYLASLMAESINTLNSVIAAEQAARVEGLDVLRNDIVQVVDFIGSLNSNISNNAQSIQALASGDTSLVENFNSLLSQFNTITQQINDGDDVELNISSTVTDVDNGFEVAITINDETTVFLLQGDADEMNMPGDNNGTTPTPNSGTGSTTTSGTQSTTVDTSMVETPLTVVIEFGTTVSSSESIGINKHYTLTASASRAGDDIEYSWTAVGEGRNNFTSEDGAISQIHSHPGVRVFTVVVTEGGETATASIEVNVFDPNGGLLPIPNGVTLELDYTHTGDTINNITDGDTITLTIAEDLHAIAGRRVIIAALTQQNEHTQGIEGIVSAVGGGELTIKVQNITTQVNDPNIAVGTVTTLNTNEQIRLYVWPND